MEKRTYKTTGTCAVAVNSSIDDNGNVHDVNFVGGCDGNLKAIATLVEGKPATEIAELLKGNTCGRKSTSCADQFSKALLEAVGQ